MLGRAGVVVAGGGAGRVESRNPFAPPKRLRVLFCLLGCPPPQPSKMFASSTIVGPSSRSRFQLQEAAAAAAATAAAAPAAAAQAPWG